MVTKTVPTQRISNRGDKMKDESHLPVAEQSLLFRLRKRAEIRRQIPGRLAVIEGKPDRIANLLDEAANEIERLNAVIKDIGSHTVGRDNFQP
jgi:PP-loop superfamily ATP-utilizing enzyme